MKDLISNSLDDALQEGLVLYVKELTLQLSLRGIAFHALIDATSSIADTHGYPDTVVRLLENAVWEAQKHEAQNQRTPAAFLLW